jgi:hypothetical protein
MKNYDSKTNMDARDDKMKKMLYYAYRCLNVNEMLISHSDGWLSAEEGNKNLMKAIEERERTRQRKSFTRFFRIFRILRFKKNMFNFQNSTTK